MTVSDADRHFVFDRDRGFCQYCGEDLLRSLSIYRSAEIDHILPHLDANRDKPDWLVTCCGPCNKSLSKAHKNNLNTFAERKSYLETSIHMEGYRQKYQQHLDVRKKYRQEDNHELLTITTKDSR